MKAATLQQARPDPRAALAASIAARDTAKSVLKESTETLARANEAARLAEEELVKYEGVDREIAERRAASLKAGENNRPLPDSLLSKRIARNAAQEKVEEIQNALALLRREHTEAEQSLRTAEQAVTTEAFKVLIREASIVADELRGLRREVFLLSDRLTGLVDGVLGPSMLPQVRTELLHEVAADWQNIVRGLGEDQPPQHALGSPMDPVRIAAGLWREWHVSLMSDPNSELTWK